MNILYITNHLNTGGITSYVLALGKGLHAKGHKVYVASSGGEILPQFLEAGIEFKKIPIKTKKEIGLKVLLSTFFLAGFIKKQGIEIVHSNSRTTQVVGEELCRITGVRHISTCHGFFKKRFLRRMFPCWGEKVIAISQQVKEHLINDFEVKENSIALISNGIDTQRFAPFTPQERRKAVVELGLSGGPVVGIIARLSDVKGHQYLIEATKIVLESFPHAQLLIVGEGKMKQELAGVVERLGIEKNVSFVASMPDTRKALAVMDVFVLPSLKEGLGLALMEAMASGVSVVGSDIGGIQSLIINNFNGLLVGPKDVQGLAAAVLELLKEPEKREAFARQARALILEKFSSEKMVLETERIYGECLSAKG